MSEPRESALGHSAVAYPPHRRINGGKSQLDQAELSRISDQRKSRHSVKWTADEDAALIAAVRKHGEMWTRVSPEVPNRSNVQCSQRWNKALRPGLVRGKWRAAEDALLLKALAEIGFTNVEMVDWSKVALKVDGRNAKQCKERFRLKLDPALKRVEWTAEEDALLLASFEKCKGRWAEIAKDVPGRREDAVKIRFRSLQRQASRVRPWSFEEDVALVAWSLAASGSTDKESALIAKRSQRSKALRFRELRGKHPLIKSAAERKASLSIYEIKRVLSINATPVAVSSMPLTASFTAVAESLLVKRAASSRAFPQSESVLSFGFASFSSSLPLARLSSFGLLSQTTMPPRAGPDGLVATTASASVNFGASLSLALANGKKLRVVADAAAPPGEGALGAPERLFKAALSKSSSQLCCSGMSESSAHRKVVLGRFESSAVWSIGAESVFDFSKWA